MGSVKLFSDRKLKGCCGAELVARTANQTRYRYGRTDRAFKIHHVRGTARFWHWHDDIDRLDLSSLET